MPLRVELAQEIEDALGEQRGQAERRFVEHEQDRVRHEGATDGEHLLLAAGERPARLRPPFLEHGEELVDAIEVRRPAVGAPGVRAHLQVLRDGHAGEDLRPSGT